MTADATSSALALDAFDAAGRRFALGAPFGAVLDALGVPAPVSPRHVTVDGGAIGPFVAAHSTVYGPATSRPVLHVAHSLHPFDGDLFRAAARWLGPTDVVATGHDGHAWSASHHATWTLGPLRVVLARYGAPRVHAGETTVGLLTLQVDPCAVAEPYLPQFRCIDAGWHHDPAAAGSVRVLASAAQPMFSGETPPPDAVDAWVAVMRPALRATPRWVADDLGPTDVALWAHPNGAWGIARREATLLCDGHEPVRLHHDRIAPARGSGGAQLGPVDGHTFVTTAPGEAGLDALVEAARGRGAVVRVQQGLDE